MFLKIDQNSVYLIRHMIITGPATPEADPGPAPEGDRRAQGQLSGGCRRRGRRQQRLHRRVSRRDEEGGRPRVLRGAPTLGKSSVN